MDSIPATKTPKVSIIIPAYNTADLIGGCLQSVFAQTYQDFEAIVVNDGSPDTLELEKVLQPYIERIDYIKQPNKRAAGARNTAIRKARGEFLAFLDSDDAWLPEHLASQMGLFDKDPTLGMVYSNALLAGDPSGTLKFMDKCPSAGPATFEALVVERCQVSVSTVVVRKDAIVKAGLFDESLLRCDDYDMWLRTAFHGAKIGYSSNVQARLNEGRPGSLGQSTAKMAEAYWMILEKTARSLALSDAKGDLVRTRAVEIRSRYLLEEGKCRLQERQFDEARRLFSEANQHFRRPALGLAIAGLRIAPGATNKLISLWDRIRHPPFEHRRS
jgi:glycosyltransferase involved in cell wall biosynthesis